MSADIHTEDTVRVIGYRGRGVVDFINPRTGVISVSFTTSRSRTIHVMSVDVAPDRVTLIRRGNRDLDICNAMFAKTDTEAAYRDGTASLDDCRTATDTLLALLDRI